MEESSRARSRSLIRAVASTVVPDASELDEAGWAELERIVEVSVKERPPPIQRRFRVFLRLIEWTAVLRYGRPFTSLDTERRAIWLRRFENHSIRVIRLGFWGLKTLVLMGYYGQPAVACSPPLI